MTGFCYKKKKKNCIYLWNCTFVLLHLELSSVDNDLLWHLISPCPLHPIAISFVCYLLYLHHTSWMSWNYFFKSTENLVKKYYFCLIDKRKRHKQNVCLGICQLWKMLHWFFVQHRLCNLYFAWLCLIDKVCSPYFYPAFFPLQKEKSYLVLNITIISALPWPPA